MRSCQAKRKSPTQMQGTEAESQTGDSVSPPSGFPFINIGAAAAAARDSSDGGCSRHNFNKLIISDGRAGDKYKYKRHSELQHQVSPTLTPND